MAVDQTKPQHNDVAPPWARAIGGRKFLLAIIVILVASVALFLQLLTGDLWFGAVGLALGAYCGANAASHWSNRPHAPQPSPQINLPRLDLPGTESHGIGDNIDPNAG